MTRLSVLATVAAMLLLAALPAQAQPHLHACDAAAARAERDWNVPAGVLSAVGTVESGRTTGPLGRAPWPWTINAAGQGSYFETKQEAIAAVLALMARGYPYIDIGCFQIDIAYHPDVFLSLEDAFDPDRNAQAAARILATERLRAPDWSTAVARYHSATPGLGLPYLQLVRAALPAAKLRGVTAEFTESVSASQPYVVQIGAPSAVGARRLPEVIYAAAAPVGRQPQILQMDTATALPRVIGADLHAQQRPR